MRSHLRLLTILAMVAPAVLGAQESNHPFLRGLCVGNDSALAPDSYVEHPERRPALTATSNIPHFPESVARPGYNGTVVAAFVVEANGQVRTGSVAIISSTDPVLSAWACKAVLMIHFEPGRDHGKKVASQAVMPFTYRSQLPPDTSSHPDSQPAAKPPLANVRR